MIINIFFEDEKEEEQLDYVHKEITKLCCKLDKKTGIGFTIIGKSIKGSIYDEKRADNKQ